MKSIKKIFAVILSALTIVTAIPVTALIVPAEESSFGKVEAITQDAAIVGTSKEVTVSYEKKPVKLQWAEKNDTRAAGWWVGIKVTAPTEAAAVATYDTKYNGFDEWTRGKKFSDAVDGTDENGAYATFWGFVNEAVLNTALLSGKYLVNEYEFDWDGDKQKDQSVTVKINPEVVELYNGKDKVYPSDKLGRAEPITAADCMEITDGKNSSNIIYIENNKKIELQWSPKNDDRGSDGWWAGIKVTAPQGANEQAKYISKYNGFDKWNDAKSFLDANDGDKNDNDNVYVTFWGFVNEAVLNNAIINGDKLVNEYKFDWDADGVYEQHIIFTLNPEDVVLYKNKNKVYPSDKLGTAEPITAADCMEITDRKNSSNIIYIENNKKVELQWSPKNDDRGSDGWWAGIKVTAPQGANEQAKYISKYNGFDKWNDAKNFNKAQDGDENGNAYVTFWGFVNEAVIKHAQDNNTDIVNEYKFDWDADGVYEQHIIFTLNPDDITLNPDNRNAMDTIAPIIKDAPENAKVWSTKESVTIEFGVVDEGEYATGIASVQYAKKGSDKKADCDFNEKTGTYSFVIEESFQGYYTIYATDKQGNCKPYDIKVMLDNEEPTLELGALDTSEWTNQGINITASARDNVSGINALYCIKGNVELTAESIAEYEACKMTPADKENYEYTIEPTENYEGDFSVYAVDNAGNISLPQTISVKIDVTKCSVVSAVPSNADWTNDNVTVNGSFSDKQATDESGVKSIYYIQGAVSDAELTEQQLIDKKATKLDSVTTSDDGKTGTYSFEIKKQNYNGTYCVYAVDRAGNVSDKQTFSVQMDIEKPVVESPVLMAGDKELSDKDWTNQDITVTVDARDEEVNGAESGIKTLYCIKEDVKLTAENIAEYEACKMTLADNGKYSFVIPKQDYSGNYSIYALDNAGNISTKCTVTVHMDITPPTELGIKFEDLVFSRIINTITFGYYQNKVAVTFGAKDDLSGIKEYKYSYIDVENGNKKIEGNTSNGKITVSGDYMLKIFNFTAIDQAGNHTNFGKENERVIVDSTPPTSSIVYSGIDTQLDNAVQKTVGSRIYYQTVQQAAITVNDKNFYAAAQNKNGFFVTTEILSKDVNGYAVSDAVRTVDGKFLNNTDEINAYFRNPENWITDEKSFTHTISFLLCGDANYTIKFNCMDSAGNAAKELSSEVTVDTTAPKLELTYSKAVASAVLEKITFGIYKSSAKATITATDETTPIESISYKTVKENGASDVNKFSIDKTVSVGDAEFKADNEDKGEAVTKFEIEPNFRGYVDISAKNYSQVKKSIEKAVGKGTITVPVKDKNEDVPKDFDGIIVDDIAPKLTAVTATTPDLLIIDSARDKKITINKEEKKGAFSLLNNKNYIPCYDNDVIVKISINEANFDFAKAKTTVKVNGNVQDVTWNGLGDVYTAEIKLSSNGRYNIDVNCTDASGNSMTYTSQDIIIDKYAPKITDFAFKTEGDYYYKDASVTKNTQKPVSNNSINHYDYYFESDFTVTVSASDAIKGEESAVGIKDIILLAQDVTNKKLWVVKSDNTTLNTANGKTANSKSFTISGPFKGNLYAIAIDRLGHYPTSKSGVSWKTAEIGVTPYTLPDALKINGLESGALFVTPNDSIIEDMDKHLAESSISITPIRKDSDAEEKERAKDRVINTKAVQDKTQDAQPDDKLEYNVYKPSGVDIFKRNVQVKLAVEDNYSGIRQVDWYVMGREGQDTKNDQSGTLIIDNNGKAAGNREKDWTFTKNQSDNLVCSAEKTITVKNNSNDIIILVVLTDRSGNKTYDCQVIGIDKTAPKISVEYADNNERTGNYAGYYNKTRKVTLNVTERNFDPAYIYASVVNVDPAFADAENVPNIKGITNIKNWRRDNNPNDKTYSYDIYYKKDGKFKFDIEIDDAAANSSSRSEKSFIIDKTAPKIKVALGNDDVRNKIYFNADRTATITVTEHNFNQKEFENLIKASLNGNGIDEKVTVGRFKLDSKNNDIWTATAKFSADADYVLDFTYTDKAGNVYKAKSKDFSGQAAKEFTVDKTKPEIEILANGKDAVNAYAFSEGPVIKIRETDNNCSDITTSLKGSVWKDGQLNSMDVSSSNGSLNEDHHNAKFVVTYDKVTQDGFYTITASCVDMAGNKSNSVKIEFTNNEKGSVYVAGDALSKLNNSYRNKNDVSKMELYFYEYSPTPVESTADKDFYININGKKQSGYITREIVTSGGANWYCYKYTVKQDMIVAEGQYDIFTRSYSKLGNGSSITNNNTKKDAGHSFKASFVIDNTNPYVRISGLENHRVFATSQDVKLTISDNNLYKVKATVSQGENNQKVYLWVNASDLDKYQLTADEAGAQLNQLVFDENDDTLTNIELMLGKDDSELKLEICDLASNYSCNADDYNKDDLFVDSSERLKLIADSENDNQKSIQLTDITITDNRIELFIQSVEDNQPMAIAIFAAVIVVIGIIIIIPILVKRRKKLDEADKTEIE